MTLSEGFLFSQSNLQDYVDCQRRFQLRYMLHLAWPAVEAEPYLENESRMDQGAQFHKIVRQFLVGIPEDEISGTICTDEVMQSWWSNFLSAVKAGNLEMIRGKDKHCFEEITLSVPIGKFRLIAKYDLLVIHADTSVTIFDWKTSLNHPRRKWLADRLQTHVYPFVVTGALSNLTGGLSPDPSQVEMIYWFANQPEQPERFSYSPREYQEDKRMLESLVATIDQKTEPVFPLTPDERRCLFCTYRSLCNRGVRSGDLQQMQDWEEPESAEDVSIDLDQIGEIEG
jgi:CRISPR/Cas system-associated exonuclease Cas4 (RecB family)